MSLTKKTIAPIAKLARIQLTEKTENILAKDLGAVLDYINKLNEINTDGIEPTAQVTGLGNIFREDKNAIAAGAYTRKIVDEFPHKKGDYLKVKQVFEHRE